MANNIAFQPMGKSIRVTASNATVTNATLFADSPVNQYMIGNHDTKAVYVWISPSTNPVNVSIPTGSGSSAGYAVMVPPSWVTVISGPQSSNNKSVQVSVLSENGSPEVYITPGEGL